MSSTNDLVSRLTATLVTKAEEITVTETRFDRNRPASVEHDDLPQSRSDRRRPAVPAASGASPPRRSPSWL